VAGQANVAEDLAARVHEAAGELGYTTNPAARALRRGRAGAVAIIVPASDLEGQTGPFVTAPIRAATRVLFNAAIQPVLLLDEGRDADRLVRHLSAGHVDAAVAILLYESSNLDQAFENVPIPIVYVGRPSGADTSDRWFVEADQVGGGRQAAHALLSAGRRRLGVLTAPRDYVPGRERLQGFQEECHDWGVPPGPHSGGVYEVETGIRATHRLLQRDPEIDGIFATSDLLAIGALRALASTGRRVPDDVAVVGFDDTVVAATTDPPLTSVRQPFDELGTRAARLALDQLSGKHTEPHRELVPTTVTVREST
jgi:DNA-binding LacI/PurR family transcriptional regulator